MGLLVGDVYLCYDIYNGISLELSSDSDKKMSSLDRFTVVCDETNNTEENKANRELNVSIYLTPDEIKYHIVFDANKNIEEKYKYYRFSPRWFQIIDDKLGEEVTFEG